MMLADNCVLIMSLLWLNCHMTTALSGYGNAVSSPSEVDIKDPAVVTLVDDILIKICKCSHHQVSCGLDPIVYGAQILELLPLVPDEEFLGFLDKIRAGQYCDDYQDLEYMFLYMAPFSGEPGALKLISQELAAGRDPSMKSMHYLPVAMLLLTRPTLSHITALTPLFGMTNIHENIKASVSMVRNRYSTQNVDCDKIDKRTCQEVDIKDSAVVPLVDAILTNMCKCTLRSCYQDIYTYKAQLIELLYRVPDDEFLRLLDKIRAGKYCADYSELEFDFLLQVPFSGEPGAFKVISLELAAGRYSPWRDFTNAMILLTRPTLSHITALKPIFGMEDIHDHFKVGVAIVINKYCAQNVECDKRFACIQSVTQDDSLNQTVLSVSHIEAAMCTKWDDFQEVINAIFPEK